MGIEDLCTITKLWPEPGAQYVSQYVCVRKAD